MFEIHQEPRRIHQDTYPDDKHTQTRLKMHPNPPDPLVDACLVDSLSVSTLL